MMVLLHSLSLSNTIYEINDLDKIKLEISNLLELKKQNKVFYYNIPCAFDIETSSFFQQIGNNEPEKTAIMYIWTFSICGYVIMGRTWDEFLLLYDKLIKVLELNINKRIIVYVHNLSFDFSFFRKWLKWSNVFSIKERTPIYALTIDGIEFRCSYLLSGYKLEKIAEHLEHYKIKKLVGDIDYNLLRHSKTEITDKEKQYCINDVQIIIAYIAEKIIKDGGIQNIPLTKTGYVRNYCRNICFYPNGVYEPNTAKEALYKRLIHHLNLSSDEYFQLKRAFQGGFTHANPFYIDEIVENVSSYDFNSSYPSVLVSEKYPMSSSELFTKISKDDFNYSIQNYCCLFEVEFFNLQSAICYDSYISRYRCREVVNPICSNGRIVSAEHLKTTITEQDYIIISKFYKWDKMKIANFRRYKRGYLPTDFIKAVLKLYADKTKLKGVSGMEIEYLQSKEMLNSIYGMIVTDIIRDEILYIDNKWENEDKTISDLKSDIDYEKEIYKYNKNKKRFNFYPWGVWVTAYARKNLFTGIMEFKTDYIYSDTDSIKVINADKHKKYIEQYNFTQKMKLYAAMSYHKLPIDLIEPVTNKGDKKVLGIWDYEGTYKRFKTLGAKRYMIETEEGVNITVAGLNKKVCVPYIIEHSPQNPFKFFTNEMEIPSNFTGKQTHTYIDIERGGMCTDYNGVTSRYYEKSSVHLSASPYKMSMTQEFIDYVRNIKTMEGE